MFNLDEEDDEDFNLKPETSSKLANLFDSNEINLDVDSVNKSLKYVPPKQPKKFELTASSSGDNPINSSVMVLIHASAVNVFKFENGKYTAQGKLGAALLGNHDTGSYKLIIYTGKQQHITFASINDNFNIICQPNNYFSFYDDNRQNWSVMFDTEDEKHNFSRQLTVCKFNVFVKQSENQSKFLTQDLVIGNESSLLETEDNDLIELRYKGWVFEDNQTSGKLFSNVDSSAKKPFRIKLIGKWTQMLKGMKTSGKRFVIFNLNLKDELIGILDNAPIGHNCKYGFDFELIKIQSRVQQKPEIKTKVETKDKNKSKELKNNSELTLNSSSITESDKENEILSKPKSDILSRVTRMGGLPIFPMKTDIKQPETLNDTTDAIDDESSHLKPHPKPRNSSIVSTGSQSNENHVLLNQSSSELVSNQQNSSQIQVNSLSNNSMTFSPYFMAQTNLETTVSILSAESRSNQTENRMNFSKIIDKIDSIADKVSDIKNSSSAQINSMSTIGFMDSTILLSSIQRIVNENSSLKKEVEEKTSNLQKLNEKIVDLLHIQSSGAQQNSSKELDRLLMTEKLLQREISDLTQNCDRFRTQTDELTQENSRLRKTIEELRCDIESRPNVSRIESNSGQSKDTLTQIKRLMNDVFRKINAQFDENKSYKSDEIIDIVSNCIRNTTLSLMESRNNSRTSSPSFRQSIDEIDKIKQNFDLKSETVDNNKETEKPPIPQRKSIEDKQINRTNEPSEEESTQEVLKSDEPKDITN